MQVICLWTIYGGCVLGIVDFNWYGVGAILWVCVWVWVWVWVWVFTHHCTSREKGNNYGQCLNNISRRWWMLRPGLSPCSIVASSSHRTWKRWWIRSRSRLTSGRKMRKKLVSKLEMVEGKARITMSHYGNIQRIVHKLVITYGVIHICTGMM